MDSRYPGVPLSATQMAPKAVPSTGIRAPLTVDDSDSEYSVSSKSYNNSPTSSYYRGSESQGFESGEDELETAAERPYMSDGDDNTVEETHFAKEYAFSRPSIVSGESASVSSTYRQGVLRPSPRNSGAAFVQESGSGSFSELANLRPCVRIPVERSYEAAVSIGGSGSSRPYLSESDEITKEDAIVLNNIISSPAVASTDEEVLINEVTPTPIVDADISVVKKLHVPIALISEDSDDDSQGSEVLEDDGFSAIVRVPSIEILQRVNSAPKAKISDLNEDDDNEYQAENKVDMEFVENSQIGNVFMKFMNGIDKVQIGAENSFPHALSTNTNQDEGPDAGTEARVDSLYVGAKQRTIQEPEQKVYFMHSDVEIQEFNEVDDQRKSVHSFHQRRSMDLFKCNCDFGEESSPEKETKASNNYIDNLLSDDDIGNKNMDYESTQHQELDLFSSTDVKQCEFVSNGFHGENLAQETEEARRIEQYPEVLEASTLQADIKTMVDQMERDQKLMPISSGVTSQGQFPAFNCLTFSDLDKRVDSDDGMNNYEQIIDSVATGESELALSEKEKKLKKIRQLIVKYVRLLHTLEYSPEESISALVLHRLTVAESRFASDMFHLDAAMEINSESKEDLDISLTLLVIGKTGVGKSATINSIFGERKTLIDAFHPATSDVKEITGTICGVKIKAFDTPGLRTSMIDQSINKKILSAIKKLIKKHPPDIVLYVDRLDMHTSYDDDLPLFKYVTSYLGSSIWDKSIIVLTHSSSIPPEGSDGNPLSHKAVISLRSGVVQQLITHSSMNPSSTAPVSLIENKPFTEKNENGNALSSKLLLLCYSMKTLFEAGIYITIHPEIENYSAFEEEQLTLVGEAGFVLRSQDDKAYGANLLVYRRRDEYHNARDRNLESQISVTKNLKVSRAGWDRERIEIKTVCSYPLQVAAIALVTAALAIFQENISTVQLGSIYSSQLVL